jgi:hypothetical protein
MQQGISTSSPDVAIAMFVLLEKVAPHRELTTRLGDTVLAGKSRSSARGLKVQERRSVHAANGPARVRPGSQMPPRLLMV